MIFITALVLIFLLRLRFPKGKSVAAINTAHLTMDLFGIYLYLFLPWIELVFVYIYFYHGYNSKVDGGQHTLAKYLIELCLPDYALSHFKASEIGAAALNLTLK